MAAQGVEAAQRAGKVEEPQQDVDAPLVADLQPPVAHRLTVAFDELVMAI